LSCFSGDPGIKIPTMKRIICIGLKYVAVMFVVVVCFLLMDTTQKASAQSTALAMESNKSIIRQAFDRWATGQGSFFDLLADKVNWTIEGSTPYSRTYTSKKEFLDTVIVPLNKRLSKKIVPHLINLYADGDIVIAIWEGRATATDGRPYNATYSWNMKMKDGKIIEVKAFLDGMEFSDIMRRLPISNQHSK